jgi:site-specific recombinase XerD
MNTLREALQGYLALRRGLGFKMQDAARLLPRFVSFLEDRQALHITTRLALEWVQTAKTVQPAERARRLCFIRGFARHRSATDPLSEIPPPTLLPHRSTRARPYLYTQQEVQGLLDAALQLPTAWPSTPLRPWVFHCLLGLLSVTGLRISEALDLKLDDVDIDQGILTIRAAKFGPGHLPGVLHLERAPLHTLHRFASTASTSASARTLALALRKSASPHEPVPEVHAHPQRRCTIKHHRRRLRRPHPLSTPHRECSNPHSRSPQLTDLSTPSRFPPLRIIQRLPVKS